MASKQLLFKSAAREKILRGATLLTDANRVTLGPKSKCVLIEEKAPRRALKSWKRCSSIAVTCLRTSCATLKR